MINSFQRTNITAIKDDFTFELVPVLLDMVVFDHNDHHVHVVDELVEVAVLVLGYDMFL